jgi:hypothetical protein
VTDAVAVDEARVPVNGVESIVWSGPFSEYTNSFTTVPDGTFVAAILTAIGVDLLIPTSGTVKLPVGFDGTGCPSTCVTRMDGARVVGRNKANGDARIRVGLAVPVNVF